MRMWLLVALNIKKRLVVESYVNTFRS